MNFTFDFSNFVAGLIAGGAASALITFQLTKNLRSGANGNSVDQSGSSAGGDIVGRDKNTTAK
ncbi:hypothetical protein GR197_29050 [Rhizobium phaseoli]|uniref:Uncharacterized protein n=1 Tax=Rhizobium phaseoli TaxID=396 RepID=A0A7K3UNV0_9HYPH|nr:hypothetical protein [Rhizobium phaseoli]NEJ74528.1 hypothetical protein [Rhizobium phaseoli]